MASVGQAYTGTEMPVRRRLHRSGYRFTLHRRDLPGRPDLVFTPRRKVIFVHGCFRHGQIYRNGRLPTSRVEYWSEKIDKNRARDARNVTDIQAMGWASCIVCRCETADPDSLKRRLARFLDGDSS